MMRHDPVHIEHPAEAVEDGLELRIPVGFVEGCESRWRRLSHGSTLAERLGSVGNGLSSRSPDRKSLDCLQALWRAIRIPSKTDRQPIVGIATIMTG
jgi:hypothetical protein